jgi:sec-independent protein translocase protein TatA
MLGIGPLELVIVLIIVLVLFGAKRLPETGRSLGAGMRGFKDELLHPDENEPARSSHPVAGEIETTSTPEARSLRD